MDLTEEQLDIIQSDTDLKVNAVAGSGKTSTLMAYAEQRPKKRILYLVFNRSVKEEARQKFQSKGLHNVRVETAHSLAYSAIVRNRPIEVNHQGYSTYEVRELLQLSMGDLILEMKIANQVLKMASCFCNGSERLLKDCDYLTYLPYGEERTFAEEYFDLIHQQTRSYLGMMHRAQKPITHEFYLKQYQLSNPQLDYDIILFDEGQDASGVMLDVFVNQKARKVIVGDQNQQIYSWRYAINALLELDFQEKMLTSSFRFPQDIADRANEVLARKELLGFPPFASIKGLGEVQVKTQASKATLGRTNAGLLIRSIDLLLEEEEIKTLYFEGNFDSYTYADENGSIWDILNLHLGKKQMIRNKLIKGMSNMDKLKKYAEDTNDSPLKGLIEVVLKYEKDLPYIIKSIKNAQVDPDEKESADMIFSTIHKAKGMEYDEVSLVNDFMTEERLQETIEATDKRELDTTRLSEEVNLLYVGVTRTRHLLDMPNELLPVDQRESESAPEIEDFRSFTRETTPKPKTEKAYSVEAKRQSNKNAYKKWTSEEDQELQERLASGESPKVIADRMGRNKGAIYSRIKKLGIWED